MDVCEACPEDIYEAEQAATSVMPEPMPVEKVASFSGTLEIHRFRHTDNDAPGTTQPPEPKALREVEEEALSNMPDGKTTSSRSPGPIRSSRRRTRETTVTPPAQTTSSKPNGNSISSQRAISRVQRPPRAVGSIYKDTIEPGLILLLVGVNPGIMTGVTGFAYAHPTNQFWKLLHSSGITPKLHPPKDTIILPKLYRVGNTNVVERPTRDASMLSKQEMNDGVPILEAKIRENRPEAVCLVGKGIWEAVFRVKKGRSIRKEEFKYGWQDPWVIGEDKNWGGAPIFVATTTSGVSTSHTLAQKQEIWADLGQWVKERREARYRDLNHESHHDTWGSCSGFR